MFEYDNVLVVAAHPDDEVLGCGGTMARLSQAGVNVDVLLIADGEKSRLNKNQLGEINSLILDRQYAAEQARSILGSRSVECLDFPDNALDTVAMLDVVKVIENRIEKFRPDLVLTHHPCDVNIDHRIIHEAVTVACRQVPGFSVKELLFFEVMSSTEWRPVGKGANFEPNYFVDISSTIELKKRALQAYDSEMRSFPHPRSLRATEALANWRGATVGVIAAEAFVLGRRVINSS